MSRWRRRLGISVGSLITVLAAGVAVIWGLTERRFGRRWEVEPREVVVASDSASVARGRHLVQAVAKCTDCHGDDLGGVTLVDDGTMGRLASANLTPGRGGIGARYTDTDWVRAIRHGVNRGGHGMVIMPTYSLGDADLGAVVSYLKTLPPVDRDRPSTKVRLLPRALMTFGLFPPLGAEKVQHDSAGLGPVPSVGVTKEYGEYLARNGGCTGCHRPNLAGGEGGKPGSPPASNLTPGGIGHWTEADFFRALREGKRPGGSTISDAMPWKAAGKMTDDEIRAVWMYLRSVPAKEFGES